MAFGAAYLQSDRRDLNSNRVPWGQCDIRLHLAGADYAFTGLSDVQAAAVNDRYSHYVRAANSLSSDTVGISVYRCATHDFVPVETKGWVYGLELDYQPTMVEMAGPQFAGQLRWGSDLYGNLWTSHERELVAHGTFENYLRVLLAYRLLEQGGVLLHSAGVADGDDAYVFFGRSGAGKTTISRLSLSAGLQVLSDDMNCVRWTQGGPTVEALPFAGDLPSLPMASDTYPLRALSCLEKSAESSLEPLSTPRALAGLLSCASFVNRDPHRSERLMANLESIIEEIPAKRLRFTRDIGFWDLLRAENQTVNG